MPKIKFITIQVLALILIISLFELITSFFFGHRLFYDPEDVSESNHALYQKLDVNLGYTFSTTRNVDGPLTFSLASHYPRENGYFKFEHTTDSAPIRILVLGGSATDSNLFGGNWPYQLHKIFKDKNIPHVILNGAVSGYNSGQELVKLIRDLPSLGKIDIAIIFDGLNDSEGGGDIDAVYPFVHPYQKYLFDKISNHQTSFKRSSYLPNTVHLLLNIKSILAPTQEVEFGPPQKNYVERYTKNIQYLTQILKTESICFLHIIQPIFPADQISDHYPSDYSLRIGKETHLFLNNAFMILNKKVDSLSYKDLLPTDPPNIFIDHAHFNEYGNTFVAKAVLRDIKKLKCATLQKKGTLRGQFDKKS